MIPTVKEDRPEDLDSLLLGGVTARKHFGSPDPGLDPHVRDRLAKMKQSSLCCSKLLILRNPAVSHAMLGISPPLREEDSRWVCPSAAESGSVLEGVLASPLVLD